MFSKQKLILGACGILQDEISALTTSNYKPYHLFIHQANIY